MNVKKAEEVLAQHEAMKNPTRKINTKNPQVNTRMNAEEKKKKSTIQKNIMNPHVNTSMKSQEINVTNPRMQVKKKRPGIKDIVSDKKIFKEQFNARVFKDIDDMDSSDIPGKVITSSRYNLLCKFLEEAENIRVSNQLPSMRRTLRIPYQRFSEEFVPLMTNAITTHCQPVKSLHRYPHQAHLSSIWL